MLDMDEAALPAQLQALRTALGVSPESAWEAVSKQPRLLAVANLGDKAATILKKLVQLYPWVHARAVLTGTLGCVRDRMRGSAAIEGDPRFALLW